MRAIVTINKSHELCAHRFVVLLAKEHDYFFFLYIANFAAEGWLAILALFNYPSLENLEAQPEDPNNPVYEVCIPFTPPRPEDLIILLTVSVL